MARRIWQSDFARLWFGLRGATDTRVDVGKGRIGHDPCASTSATLPGPGRPLGIVERNRLARRQKWALKQPE